MTEKLFSGDKKIIFGRGKWDGVGTFSAEPA